MRIINISAPLSKDIWKNFSLASYTIQFATTGNTVNSYLTSTVDKTHHELVIAPFSVQVLKFFLALSEVS